MRPEKRNDYRVAETVSLKGQQVWQVTIGGDEKVTTCSSKEHAEHIAKQLNLDPWFLDRGYTRADIIARS